MGTLEEIQRLTDSEFHLLGDAVLRRLETRYRRLRTHGVNHRGESIKGQPDSYVGDSAATASIAVCYTVERVGWWNKVVKDVRKATAASPDVAEVVVVVPRNVDRDGPKDKTIDWMSQIREIAGKATIRVIDGRDIAQALDNDHQDLRYEHLGIPHSRLSASSIVAACRIASLHNIESIKSSGRYDPARYSPRSADRELYRLWQSAFSHRSEKRTRTFPVRMLALINDSGFGKTSLVCEFARTLGAVLPVLIIQARDLAFGTEDSLVAAVIHRIQGFLDPASRAVEEAALGKVLGGTVQLTVVLDGLDEAHNPEAVRKAITYWLRSKLCQVSVLIVTSRREFWQGCADPSWRRWMPNPNPDDRVPIRVADQPQSQQNDPLSGFSIPALFSEEELEAAWTLAGCPRSELFSLPNDAIEELRHPFTLRVFLDLRLREENLPRTITKSVLLDRWLRRRLEAESLSNERITPDQFQRALQIVASRIADSSTGSISVDELSETPRFDPSHPPGPVLKRLIDADILESLPQQSDRIRFRVEAVQDFYRAEADVEAIKREPSHVAIMLSQSPFTTVYPRLARIGYRLVADDVRHQFIKQLLDADPMKAAILLRASPSVYTAEVRSKLVADLGAQITSRHRVRAALAITLLGELDCRESLDVLTQNFLTTSDLHSHLNSLAATAFANRSYIPAAAFVYRWEWFGVRKDGDSYYFRDVLANVRNATREFRLALADCAAEILPSASGSKEHAKAVTVLAYVGDERLVDHLGARLTENGLLTHYENHALIALGTDAAGDLFAKSVLAIGSQLARLPDDHHNNEARNILSDPVYFPVSDVRYLVTPAFARHLRGLIHNSNRDISHIGCDLAKRTELPAMVYAAAVTAATRKEWTELDWGRDRSHVTADIWLGWWRQSTEVSLRRKLLTLVPRCPVAEIEELLADCLDSPDLCGLAARRLGEYGAIRSAIRLREILAKDSGAKGPWHKAEVARALGDLRDDSAVVLLETCAAKHSESVVVQQAISSLGLIGNQDAELALGRLLCLQKDERFENLVFEALLYCGSSTAVAQLVNRAVARPDGLVWLTKRLRRSCMVRGWHRGEYYTHIDAGPLVEYFESQLSATSPEHKWEAVHAFEQIDGTEVRTLLRTYGISRGSPEDLVVKKTGRRLSDLCYEQLQDRGDVSAIPYTLDERVDEEDEIYVTITNRQLLRFHPVAIAEHIRQRLSRAVTNSEKLRLVTLLGRFGESTDAELASQLMNDPDDLLANVACETMLRLSDPLRVPDRWRTM
jgi:hypothetical protein